MITPVGGPGPGFYPIGEEPPSKQMQGQMKTILARAHDMSGQVDETQIREDFEKIRDAMEKMYELVPQLPAHKKEDASALCKELDQTIHQEFYINVANDAEARKTIDKMKRILGDFEKLLGRS